MKVSIIFRRMGWNEISGEKASSLLNIFSIIQGQTHRSHPAGKFKGADYDPPFPVPRSALPAQCFRLHTHQPVHRVLAVEVKILYLLLCHTEKVFPAMVMVPFLGF